MYAVVDRYANFMGSIGGILWSVMLLAVWLVIGSFMGYSNANWWLIIGTYTGLVSCASCSSTPDGVMQLPQAAHVAETPLTHKYMCYT